MKIQELKKNINKCVQQDMASQTSTQTSSKYLYAYDQDYPIVPL